MNIVCVILNIHFQVGLKLYQYNFDSSVSYNANETLHISCNTHDIFIKISINGIFS